MATEELSRVLTAFGSGAKHMCGFWSKMEFRIDKQEPALSSLGAPILSPLSHITPSSFCSFFTTSPPHSTTLFL